eukprot:8649580-Alexandrium_andersonii.AAC.1
MKSSRRSPEGSGNCGTSGSGLTAGTTAVGWASACPERGGDAAGSSGAASSIMEDCGCAASTGANGMPCAGPPSSC